MHQSLREVNNGLKYLNMDRAGVFGLLSVCIRKWRKQHCACYECQTSVNTGIKTSYDISSESVIKPCIKKDNPLVN